MTETELKDFLSDPARYVERTAEGPVTIAKDGEAQCVLLSNEDYSRLKLRERRLSQYVNEFTEEDLEDLKNAEYDDPVRL